MKVIRRISKKRRNQLRKRGEHTWYDQVMCAYYWEMKYKYESGWTGGHFKRAIRNYEIDVIASITS